MLSKSDFFVVKQYLKSAKRGFLAFLFGFSFAGVFIGVSALIIVIAVMTGFQQELKKRIIGMTPHIMLTKFFDEPIVSPDSVMNIATKFNGVSFVEPYVLTKTIVVKGEYTDGIIVKGIRRIPDAIDSAFVMGRGAISDSTCLLGVNLAALMRASPGDTLKFYSPTSAKQTPFGTVLKSEKLVVAGVFDAGMYDYNTSLILTSIKAAQKIAGINGVSGIEIDVKKPESAGAVAKKIERKLGYPFTTTTWMDMNKSLFAALKLEKFTMFIILSLIVLVASFGIITTMMMMILEKTREIGILRTIGYTKSSIRKIFSLIGFIIGGTGVISGGIFGIVMSYLLSKYQFIHLPPDVYFINHIAVRVKTQDVLIITISALAIVFLATIIPSIKASKLSPVEAVRYE